MGVRFFGEANDINGNTYKVEIHDTSFASTPTEITLGGGIFNRDYDGYDSLLFTPILASRCMIPIVVKPTDTPFETFVSDLPLATENQYYIIIKKNTVNWFIGNLLVDQISFDDNKTYVIELTATDGLKRLSNYYFNYINTTSSTYIKEIDLLIEALKPVGFEQFYGNSDIYIEDALTWFEIDHDATNRLLNTTRLQRELFYEDVEKLIPKKCDEVLEIILKKYGATISFEDGRWVIYQFGNHSGTTATIQYSKLATYVGTSFISNDRTLSGNNSTRDRLINTYLPALNRVEISQTGESEWAFGQPRGTALTPGFSATRSVTSLADEQMIISFDLMVSDILPSGFRNYFRLIWEITDGTYYLKYDLATGVTSWTTNSSDRYFYDISGYPNSGVNRLKGAFYTPLLPTGATGTTIEVGVTGISNYSPSATTPPTTQSIDFGTGNVTVSQFMAAPGTNAGTAIDQTTVAAITNVLEYSEVIEEEIAIFEQSNNVEFVKQWPQIYNGSAWVNSKEWAIGTLATSGLPLAELLAREAIYHQRKPNKLIQGCFRLDTFMFYDTLIFRSDRYVFKSGTFNAKMCEWEGDWVQLTRTASGTSISVDEPIYGDMGVVIDDIRVNDEKIGAIDSGFQTVNNELKKLRLLVSPNDMQFVYDSDTTMADPGGGLVRLNTGSLNAVTQIAVSVIDAYGNDMYETIKSVKHNDNLYLRSLNDASKFGQYNISGSVTDNTTWIQIPVGSDGVGSNFTADDKIVISFTRL